jgi:hypothetical protein
MCTQNIEEVANGRRVEVLKVNSSFCKDISTEERQINFLFTFLKMSQMKVEDLNYVHVLYRV